MGPIRDTHGMPIIIDSNKAEAINIFFDSVCTVDNNILSEFVQRTAINMKMPLFTLEEIRAVLKEAKKFSACGPR